MIPQTRPCDWACKGRSADMAAWQHLALEEGQDDGQGHGATGHDEVLRAGSALALVGMGMPLGFPTSAAQDHPLGLQLSTARGTVGLVSQPVTTNAAIVAGRCSHAPSSTCFSSSSVIA